jgi:GlpG protein
VEPEADSWVIWIENDDHREKARALLSEFQQNPESPEYAAAEVTAKKLQKEAERDLRERQRKQIDLRDRWKGVWWKAWPATYLFIAASALVAFVCTDWQSVKTVHGFVPQLCNDRDSKLLPALFMQPPAQAYSFFGYSLVMEQPPLWETLKTGQVWRLVTPIFLHFDGLHILFNMMWLRTLGCAIEFVRGTRRFLALAVVIAIFSNLTQYFWSGPSFGGMSGVVFGLIGYVWVKGKVQPQYGLSLSHDQFVWSMLWMLLCIGGAFGGVANACHVSGLLLGILIGARHTIWKQLRNVLQPSDGGF